MSGRCALHWLGQKLFPSTTTTHFPRRARSLPTSVVTRDDADAPRPWPLPMARSSRSSSAIMPTGRDRTSGTSRMRRRVSPRATKLSPRPTPRLTRGSCIASERHTRARPRTPPEWCSSTCAAAWAASAKRATSTGRAIRTTCLPSPRGTASTKCIARNSPPRAASCATLRAAVATTTRMRKGTRRRRQIPTCACATRTTTSTRATRKEAAGAGARSGVEAAQATWTPSTRYAPS
mmetsp:Transcript_15563/g.37698  ORF Transcript_15563/g.37698 Transcript_15563/m.37698 type:complete len:235 (+) Transcript_15563:425-1129(+)